MSKKSDLEAQARRVGLYMATYSPGDGKTRYRFFTKPGNDYFGPDSGIYTALGPKNAKIFLDGYRR
jgi:hypothetical protein